MTVMETLVDDSDEYLLISRTPFILGFVQIVKVWVSFHYKTNHKMKKEWVQAVTAAQWVHCDSCMRCRTALLGALPLARRKTKSSWSLGIKTKKLETMNTVRHRFKSRQRGSWSPDPIFYRLTEWVSLPARVSAHAPPFFHYFLSDLTGNDSLEVLLRS